MLSTQHVAVAIVRAMCSVGEWAGQIAQIRRGRRIKAPGPALSWGLGASGLHVTPEARSLTVSEREDTDLSNPNLIN